MPHDRMQAKKLFLQRNLFYPEKGVILQHIYVDKNVNINKLFIDKNVKNKH
jgi:hypothetical protein